jgi:imidazolonepropionase-like amidohydrolase
VSATLVDDHLEGIGQRAGDQFFQFHAVRIQTAPPPASDEADSAAQPPPLRPERYPAGAFGVTGLAPQATDLVLRNATIWTAAEDGVITDADLWIRRGQIRAVDRDLKAPRGALEIDASGKHITPGIVDAHSHTAISRGINEMGSAVSVEVRIGDVVDPTDIAIYRQLAGGVTSANLLHGSANPMGGQNQVIKLRWGGDADSMKLAGAAPGVKFALGENPKQSNFGDDFVTRYPQTRMGVREIFEDTFEQARAYERTWKTRDRNALPPRRNLRLDAVLEILNAERIVHIHSYRQDEILMFARLAADWGLAVGTFQHVLEGYKVADAIAEIGAGGSTFSDWWGIKMEMADAIPYNTALMHRAGVVVSVNSDSNELARRLNLEAAKAIKYGGLSEADALATITINPARQLRIDEQTGSLEVGKDADFVVWSGPPLSSYSRVEQTWIDGRRYFDRDADQTAQAWGRSERQRLIARALAERLKRPDAKPASDPPPADMRGVDTPPPEIHDHGHDHDNSYRALYHDGSDGLSCSVEVL